VPREDNRGGKAVGVWTGLAWLTAALEGRGFLLTGELADTGVKTLGTGSVLGMKMPSSGLSRRRPTEEELERERED
jgi:hypothetical protein